MVDNLISKKIALILGTSAIVAGVSYYGNNYNEYLPEASFINPASFENSFEIKTSLMNEFEFEGSTDDPIVVPVIKWMTFRLGKPEVKSFSI